MSETRYQLDPYDPVHYMLMQTAPLRDEVAELTAERDELRQIVRRMVECEPLLMGDQIIDWPSGRKRLLLVTDRGTQVHPDTDRSTE